MALACGRTADSDHKVTGNGSGGTGQGGATAGGSGSTSHAGTTGEAGEMAAAGAPAECPVTPVAGRWVALGPDPYGFEFSNDGSSLSGNGCLGGLPERDQPAPFGCTPINVLTDSGRSLSFMWDAGPSAGSSYVVKMELTLSPERNAMAGKMWSSFAGNIGADGVDIVLVPYPDEPILPATTCSGGDPSGECFLAPLRSDRIDRLQVEELGGGDLLLLWQNQRGIGKHLASARFDAAAGTWQAAEFLDDGSAPVSSPLLAVSPGGWAMVAYTQNNALWTRAYDPKTRVWSKQLILIAAQKPSDIQRAEGLFVYDGGDATLVASNQPLDAVGSLTAYDYQASKKAWVNNHVFDDSPESAPYQWSAASDSEGRELAVWVREGVIGKPQGLWFSARTRGAAGNWTEPALFFTSEKQILRPAVAVGPDGAAIVTWQEWITRIGSSAYSFDTNTWSEPLTITTETQIDNHVVRFDDSGAAVAYLDNSGTSFPYGELKSVLSDAGWSTPQVSSELEASGATYQVMGNALLQVTRVEPRAGEEPLPPLERPRCEGY
ncbi:MAG TPA: hypothetical protein VHP33_11765 [Polyangiaceae bacterium]|nr:hypothetical protein [Polyangiaceae bacterium]